MLPRRRRNGVGLLVFFRRCDEIGGDLEADELDAVHRAAAGLEQIDVGEVAGSAEGSEEVGDHAVVEAAALDPELAALGLEGGQPEPVGGLAGELVEHPDGAAACAIQPPDHLELVLELGLLLAELGHQGFLRLVAGDVALELVDRDPGRRQLVFHLSVQEEDTGHDDHQAEHERTDAVPQICGALGVAMRK